MKTISVILSSIAVVVTVGLLVLIRQRENSIRELACVRECAHTRDQELGRVALERSMAQLAHRQALLECQINNPGDATGLQRCRDAANNDFARQVAGLTARSNAAVAQFTVCTNDCAHPRRGTPQPQPEQSIEIPCIETATFTCFREVPEICKQINSPCGDCWNSFCPDMAHEFSAATAITVSLLAAANPEKNPRPLATSSKGTTVTLAVPANVKLEKDEKLWLKFEFASKPAQNKVTLRVKPSR